MYEYKMLKRMYVLMYANVRYRNLSYFEEFIIRVNLMLKTL